MSAPCVRIVLEYTNKHVFTIVFRMKRLRLIFAGYFLAFAIVVLIQDVVRMEWKRMKTYDTMDLILATLEAKLRTTSIGDLDVATETKKMFPLRIKVESDRVIDAWGHPIAVDIRRENNGFQVKLLSPGGRGLIKNTGSLMAIVHFYDNPSGKSLLR